MRLEPNGWSLGTKLFRHHGILDARADLIADELGEVLVGLPVGHNVMEIAQPFREPGLRPQLFVQRQPLFLRDLQGLARVEVVHKAGGGFANAFVNFWVAGLELALGLRGNQPIPQRRTVIGRALEDREMADFFGDDRDELDGGGAGADDRHALAGEVHFFLRPARGVIRLALEAVDTRKWGRIPGGQDANRRDDKLRPCALATLQLDLPAIRLLVVDRRFDPRIELDVACAG